MITSGASMAARNSATRAGSTPSGTAAPSVTRPSSWVIQPTGGRSRPDSELAPRRRTGPAAQPVQSSSVDRQAFPRISTNRYAMSTRVCTASAGGTAPRCRVPPTAPPARRAKHVHTDIGAQAGHVAAAVVDAEPEPPAPARRAWVRCRSPRPGRAPRPRTSALPPLRPDSGDATMLRTRSWVADGNRPAAAIASATAPRR